jgi:hypothetical protein
MTERSSTIRERGSNLIDHLQQASGKLWREGFKKHSELIGADIRLVAALLDVAEAAQAVVARHPDSSPGEHPAVDMLRPVLERLEVQ